MSLVRWPARAAVVTVLLGLALSGAPAPASANGGPPPPTQVAARAGDANATVRWRAPNNPGGVPVTKYRVTSNPGGLVCESVGAPAPTSCTVTGLTNLQSYTFTVTAQSTLGTSGPSAASAGVTPLPGTTGVNFVRTGSVKWGQEYVGALKGGAQFGTWPNRIYNYGMFLPQPLGTVYTGADVNGDTSALTNCVDSWLWPQILCDSGAYANSRFQVDKRAGTSAGMTIATTGDPSVQGYVIIDLGQVTSFTTLRLFQMFSDGKITNATLSVSSQTGATWPTFDDATWTTVVDNARVAAGAHEAGVVTCPTVLDFGATSGRYLKLEASNSGAYGSPNYLEIGAAKVFFENTPGDTGLCPPSQVRTNSSLGVIQSSWKPAPGADSYWVTLTLRPRAGAPTVRTSRSAETRASWRMSPRPGTPYTVCVRTRNAEGTSPATCTDGRYL